MSDEYLGGDDSQTDPGLEQPQAPDAAIVEPKPITGADLDAWSKEFRKDLLNVIRSQTVQAESNIKKEVDAKLVQVEKNFKELKAAGYPVTDEDLKIAKSEAISEALKTLTSSEEDEAQPSRARSTDPKQEAVIKQANEAMRNLQKQYGYVLTENDPEFWDVPFTGVPPDEFLSKYEAGLREVVTRLGRPVPQQTIVQGSPSARIPSPVGSATGGSIEALNNELGMLQSKSGRTAADEKRRKEIEAELLKHVPRK